MKKYKFDIVKLSACFLWLVAAFFVTRLFDIPKFFEVLIFIIPYIASAYEVFIEATEDILKGKVFTEDFLMCVASFCAFILGQYSEAVFVMVFFGVGELFEKFATDNSRKNIKSLLEIRPDTAIKFENGKEILSDAKEIKKGDIIIIRPGERIALDGIIEEGKTSLDNSSLTGESMPQTADMGSPVYAGCINLNATIKVKVTKEFYESTASKILKSVEEAQDKKAKSQKFISRFAAIYTPVVCICAVLLATVPPLLGGEFKIWVFRALTFLVVSCPCALVVSVPLTYFNGIGRAAKSGILIKGAQYCETLSRVKTVLFDKTGTLTNGNFKVTAIHPEKINESELLNLAGAAEKYSFHPIAQSLKNETKSLDLPDVQNITEIFGMGIKALFEGKTLLVGNVDLMAQNEISAKECHINGTVVHISLDKEYLGHIVISDTIKNDAERTLLHLNKMKIKSIMLTGDKKSVAKNIAKKLNIPNFHAELTPQDKVAVLESYLHKNGAVCFVGDGINDSPALSRADVGIAMGALGSDAAIESADIVFMNDTIGSILKAIEISKRTEKKVKQNIYLTIFVKFAVLILSALGVAITNIWLASFADVGVLVLAVINAII